MRSVRRSRNVKPGDRVMVPFNIFCGTCWYCARGLYSNCHNVNPWAHWEFPERQPEKWPRERSIEHKFLPPVFGTACPPTGLSGVIRRYSYAKDSEGHAAHWLLLMVADRVDAWENHLKSFLTLHPDNPITETGVRSEFTHHGLKSRIGVKRADLKHQPLDPIIIVGPWVAAGGAVFAGARKLVRSAIH
ncbi:MAG: alcohol dehydrogenase catalytic domain-containing protein [Blastococcus sp.]